jgi:hypothetical protein
MLRYEYEYRWLKEHRHEVDRVLHSDSLDVFFQGDPFANEVTSDSLIFVVEPHQIRTCGWNLGWIYKCYGRTGLSEMKHRFIICSGSIAGGVGAYLSLIELMIGQPQWKTCWASSMDQPILNTLVWDGTVAKAGIKYQLVGCHSGFFTVQWCVIERAVRYNEHHQVMSTMNTVPSFVHQYDRVTELSLHFYRSCKVKKTGW